MMNIPPQHNTANPPGQIQYGPHPSAMKYRETTGKGLYLKDIVKRIQEEEDVKPAPAVTPEVMWERFITHLNAVKPLGSYREHYPHINLIGSIEEYKKLFLQANP